MEQCEERDAEGKARRVGEHRQEGQRDDQAEDARQEQHRQHWRALEEAVAMAPVTHQEGPVEHGKRTPHWQVVQQGLIRTWEVRATAMLQPQWEVLEGEGLVQMAGRWQIRA